MLQSAAICLYLDGWQCGQVRIPKGAGGWREASHSVGIFRKPLPILRGLRFSVFVQLKLFGTVRCHKKKTKNSKIQLKELKCGNNFIEIRQNNKEKKKRETIFQFFGLKNQKKGKT